MIQAWCRVMAERNLLGSMPGLVMLLGIIVYAWKHVKAKQAAAICLAAIAVQVSGVIGLRNQSSGPTAKHAAHR